jgi:beta-1,4-mannosyl-glycoprotein beta-1,4-N-acetylglucosaminyltransferase
MRIFDTFRFFNELELLELRLNVLNDVVDYFVLTESPFTISGKEKPLYYLENKDKFSKFNDKIIHNVTETIPTDFSDYIEKKQYHTPYKNIDVNCGQPFYEIPLRYQRDIYARDCTVYGLLKAEVKDDDIVIVSDADEIINPYILEDLDWFDSDNHYACLQRSFYYKLNILYQENWIGSRICSWEHLKKISADQLRQSAETAYKIESGGWHWSYFGDAEKFRAKLSACADCHMNVPEIVDTAEEKIKNGLDPLNRGVVYPTVPLDDSFPEYILNNKEKYSEFIKPWN